MGLVLSYVYQAPIKQFQVHKPETKLKIKEAHYTFLYFPFVCWFHVLIWLIFTFLDKIS